MPLQRTMPVNWISQQMKFLKATCAVPWVQITLSIHKEFISILRNRTPSNQLYHSRVRFLAQCLISGTDTFIGAHEVSTRCEVISSTGLNTPKHCWNLVSHFQISPHHLSASAHVRLKKAIPTMISDLNKMEKKSLSTNLRVYIGWKGTCKQHKTYPRLVMPTFMPPLEYALITSIW